MLLLNKVNELDVVRLKDGREGTVLEVFKTEGIPDGYLIDITDINEKWKTIDMPTVTLDEIEKVIWRVGDPVT